ncbi:hypothetical protein ABIC47_002053 [Leifsonia sp. 563]|uniref:hypothetical protein n=1 Tax=Leifsonia sp. 563 TaxID=3156412 RepID=UPI00339225A5
MPSAPDDELAAATSQAAANAATVMLQNPLGAGPFVAALVDELSTRTQRTQLDVRSRMLRSLMVSTRVDAQKAVIAGIDRVTFASLLDPELQAAFNRYLRRLAEKKRTEREDREPPNMKPSWPHMK